MDRKVSNRPGFVPFPSTHWSQLPGAGGDPGTVEAFGLLSATVARYYPALLAHLVHIKGVSALEAEDILHDFMQDKVLGRGLLSRARRDKGRFRTFVLSALDRYLISAYRRTTARKRAPEQPHEPETAADELPSGTNRACFDRAWAEESIREALRRMERECAESARPELWALFQARVVAPALDGVEPLPYAEMMKRYALASPTVAHNLLVTAKRMYVRCLEAVVADYAPEERAIREELADLRAVCREA